MGFRTLGKKDKGGVTHNRLHRLYTVATDEIRTHDLLITSELLYP